MSPRAITQRPPLAWVALAAKVVGIGLALAGFAFLGSYRSGWAAVAAGLASSAPAAAAATVSAEMRAMEPATTSADAGPAPVAEAGAPPADPGASSAVMDGRLVLNLATEQDLRRLPGIGASRAHAILALRSRLGRFHRVEELLRVKGIGRRSLARLRPLVLVDPPAP